MIYDRSLHRGLDLFAQDAEKTWLWPCVIAAVLLADVVVTGVLLAPAGKHRAGKLRPAFHGKQPPFFAGKRSGELAMDDPLGTTSAPRVVKTATFPGAVPPATRAKAGAAPGLAQAIAEDEVLSAIDRQLSTGDEVGGFGTQSQNVSTSGWQLPAPDSAEDIRAQLVQLWSVGDSDGLAAAAVAYPELTGEALAFRAVILSQTTSKGTPWGALEALHHSGFRPEDSALLTELGELWLPLRVQELGISTLLPLSTVSVGCALAAYELASGNPEVAYAVVREVEGDRCAYALAAAAALDSGRAKEADVAIGRGQELSRESSWRWVFDMLLGVSELTAGLVSDAVVTLGVTANALAATPQAAGPVDTVALRGRVLTELGWANAASGRVEAAKSVLSEAAAAPYEYPGAAESLLELLT